MLQQGTNIIQGASQNGGREEKAKCPEKWETRGVRAWLSLGTRGLELSTVRRASLRGGGKGPFVDVQTNLGVRALT